MVKKFSERDHTPNNVTEGRGRKKKGIVGTKGYVSRERKKDEPESVVGEGCRIRSDKWRKGGPGHVNRGQKKEEEEAGQMHPRAWTQVLSSLLAIRMDPRILFRR